MKVIFIDFQQNLLLKNSYNNTNNTNNNKIITNKNYCKNISINNTYLYSYLKYILVPMLKPQNQKP